MGKPDGDGARSRSRLLGLDLLRFLAILLVLGRHLPSPPGSYPAAGQAVFTTWHRGGWVGVDLFFVLSGFLVAGLLFSEYKSHERLSLARFYTRRGWKIYPPFYALIAVTMIVTLACGEPYSRLSLGSELVFLQSYLPGLWNHTWSLAVEEHFYLILPLLLAALLRLNRGSPGPLRPVLSLAACVAVGALLLRLLDWYYRPSYSHLTHSFATHLRLDSLFFGVAISYVYHFHTERFVATLTPWRRWLMAGGVLALVPAFALPLETTPFVYTAGFTVFYLGSGMLMVGVLLSDLPHNRFLTGLGELGAYSYSIYLWHMAVIEWEVPLVERVRGATVGFGSLAAMDVIGSLAVGVVMAKVVELPALRLRDRWFPARAKGPIENPPGPKCDTSAPPAPTGTCRP